jgi:predicted RecA/RadA family phage recombinase
MARNFVQPGDTLSLTAPAGGVTSGQFVIVGAFAGVAQHDAAAGASVEVMVTGVWMLPKAAATAIAAGAAVYWDGAAGNVTTTAAGNTAIGAAVKAAADADATAAVRLNGIAFAAYRRAPGRTLRARAVGMWHGTGEARTSSAS